MLHFGWIRLSNTCRPSLVVRTGNKFQGWGDEDAGAISSSTGTQEDSYRQPQSPWVIALWSLTPHPSISGLPSSANLSHFMSRCILTFQMGTAEAAAHCRFYCTSCDKATELACSLWATNPAALWGCLHGVSLGCLALCFWNQSVSCKEHLIIASSRSTFAAASTVHYFHLINK